MTAEKIKPHIDKFLDSEIKLGLCAIGLPDFRTILQEIR